MYVTIVSSFQTVNSIGDGLPMIKLTKTLAFVSLLSWGSAQAADVLPAPLLQLDDKFSHHVLVAEKSTHQLHLFQNDNGRPKLVKTVQMATGKKAGDKIFQGDHRTPEGVYQMTEFLTHEDLIKRHGKAGEIYGVGAFVMNYPNPMDEVEGKTGGGIWIHSTNDETRIDKGLDSRGCVVTANVDLIELAKYIELNRTSVVVVHNLNYLKSEAWESERTNIKKTVSDWAQAWQDEDINTYLQQYDKKLFTDKSRGNYNSFAQYKKAVFSAPGKPQVTLTNLSIMMANGYAVATFVQDYKATNLADIGKKLLYLKKNEYYEWKIVSEVWTKNGIEPSEEELNKVAFQPSMRFFKTLNPEQIMEIIPASASSGTQSASN
tara:strand:- start:3872 stop:4999 length:1128 start_codon:yes stop_codon:yes gene_type:complete